MIPLASYKSNIPNSLTSLAVKFDDSYETKSDNLRCSQANYRKRAKMNFCNPS